MLTKTMIQNSIDLIKLYLPNLWIYLSEEEFKTFLLKAFEHTKKYNGGTTKNNFIVTFFKLFEEHRTNNSQEIRTEFKYFNYLLGEFKKYGNNKEFKDLLIGALYNFESNNFHHSLGEIAVCLDLCRKSNFQDYEQTFENGKSIDFVFSNDQGELKYIDVVTIDYNKERYEKDNFQAFFDNRLKSKFESKSVGLELDFKRKIHVFPIISGITIEIIKEQSEYLKNIKMSTLEENGFQSIEPRVFGNVQGTFFNLFTIDEIVNPEEIKKNYSQHSR